MRTFRHLTQNDRDRMELLTDQGVTQAQIAKVLGVNKSTISRERRKRKRRDGRYNASAAQLKAYVKRKNSKYQGMKVESNEEMKAYVIEGLKAKRSPDEIAGRMRLERKPFCASKDAIYKWLYSSRGQKYTHLLCTKRYKPKKQRKKAKRQMIPNAVSIHDRPLAATNKSRYGHFELDTAVAPKRVNNNQAIAVGVERKSKLILGRKLKSLACKEMNRAVGKFTREVTMKSGTLDRGIENRGHESWDLPAYFADPHSPWQKPLVENSIGLLRRWFYKKGTDWFKVSEKELQEAISVLNNKHRKSLGYQSAMEVAIKHGILKKPAQ